MAVGIGVVGFVALLVLTVRVRAYRLSPSGGQPIDEVGPEMRGHHSEIRHLQFRHFGILRGG